MVGKFRPGREQGLEVGIEEREDAKQNAKTSSLHFDSCDATSLSSRLLCLFSFDQGRSNGFGFQLSPDGRWAVDPFFGPGTGLQLRSVSLRSKEVALVSAQLPAGQDVGGRTFMPFEFVFRISADSSRVLYAADQDTDDVLELYSAPIDGRRSPVRLNPPFSDTRDLFLTDYQPAFEIDAGNTRAVYLANQDQVDRVELYSVPIDGGTSVRLHPALGAWQNVRSFALAPDGGHVLYVADSNTVQQFELFSVPIGGGAAPVRLNGPLAGRADVGGQNPDRLSRQIAFVPAGRVVYRLDRDVDEYYQLFNAPIDGTSAPVELPRLDPSENVEPECVSALAGARIVYLSTRRGSANPARELYSVASDGSAPPVRLNGPLVPLGNVGPSFGAPGEIFRLAAGDTRAVYIAEERRRFQQDLFSVPVDRSDAPVRLNDVPEPSQVLPGEFGLSPDGQQVFFRIERRLYLVPVDGSAAPILVFDALTQSSDPFGIQLTSGATRALFLADPEVPDRVELYAGLLGQPPRLPGLGQR